jgi:serine/threonine protein kinase
MVTINRKIDAPRQAPSGSTEVGWKGRLEATSEQQAKISLDRLMERLNRAGHSTGVLTLHHRSRADRDMTLLRKSEGRLDWFGRRSRAADAADTVRTLFERAGKQEAVKAIDEYLQQRVDNGQQKQLSADFVKGLLNREPARDSLIKAVDDIQLDPRERYGNFGEVEKPNARLAEHEKIAQAMGCELGKRLGQGAFGVAYLMRGADGQEKVLKVYQETKKEDPKKGGLKGNKPVSRQARFERVIHDRLKFQEAQQGYLFSNKGRTNNLVNLALTEQFLISYDDGSGRQLKTVDGLGLRALLKRAGGGEHALDRPRAPQAGASANLIQPGPAPAKSFSVDILATVMPKAPGQPLDDPKIELSQSSQQQLARELLKTGQGMVSARILHRDIKPENALFDPATGTFTLIDMGLMFKQSKSRPELKFFRDNIGTPAYMHPRAASSRNYSFEADLHASALSLIRITHPRAGIAIVNAMAKEMKAYNVESVKKAGKLRPEERAQYRESEPSIKIDAAYLKKKIEDITQETAAKIHPSHLALLADLESLNREFDDPASAANLAVTMLDAAARPATEWADQATALAHYDSLMSHPFVAQPQVQANQTV